MRPALAVSSLLVLGVLLIAAPAHGQTPSLEPGASLRVHTRLAEITGEFVQWRGDSLEVTTRPVGAPAVSRSVATSDIMALDLRVQRGRGWGAARGALWVGIPLAIAGAVLIAADDCYEDQSSLLCPDSRGEGALAGAALLGGLGAGIGALAGAIWPGHRWETVSSLR